MPRHVSVSTDRGGRTHLSVNEIPRHTFVGSQAGAAVGACLMELGLAPEHKIFITTPNGRGWAGTAQQYLYPVKDMTKPQRAALVKEATHVS